MYVDFNDARDYAEWMTEKDIGVMLSGYRYRLPTEDEWVTYARCGDGREFPWGNSWPPVSGEAGNYLDTTAVLSWGERISGLIEIPGYTDGHAVAAPVDELWVNPWGLAGAGGNVWEICAPASAGGSFEGWRGASWRMGSKDSLHYSTVLLPGQFQMTRGFDCGFRLVLSR